jgi:hypothetical protein
MQIDLLLPGQLPPNFVVQEFVSPRIFHVRGPMGSIQHTTAFQFNFAHRLRTLAGVPVTINNWHRNGDRVASGTRDPNQLPPGGGALSTHYMGLALDTQVQDLTPKQVHELLQDNFLLFWEIGLTTLEDLEYTFKPGRTGWTHGDARVYPSQVLIQMERERRFQIVQPR